ncbi:flagellar hook protein FlgE [Citrobacter amalonaticus]|nr:flagellar hook protein FlgE [Citrobacter amalonaticus]
MAFSQAVSGLNAAATNLDVIGNNIANSATYGFKSGAASFADMFAGSKVGLGVKSLALLRTLLMVRHQHRSRSGCRYQPERFFRLVDSNGSVFYSRNGQFKLDENRNLVNMQGMQLTGYPATVRRRPFSKGQTRVDHIPNTLMGGEKHRHGGNADQPELDGQDSGEHAFQTNRC